MEQAIWYLREFAVMEIIFSNNKQFPTDPDDIQCMQNIWQKFLQSVPVSYVNSLGVMPWKEGEQNVDNLVTKPQIDEEAISTLLRPCVSSVERLTEDLQKLRGN